MADEDEDVKLSPEDIKKLVRAKSLLAQARGILEDLPSEFAEENGDIADAITKAEEAEDHVAECIPEEAEGDAA